MKRPPRPLCAASPHPAARDQPSAVLRPSAWCSPPPEGGACLPWGRPAEGIGTMDIRIFEEPKIDCHVHVLDPARFPYGANTHYRPMGQEMGTAAQLAQVIDGYGRARG